MKLFLPLVLAASALLLLAAGLPGVFVPVGRVAPTEAHRAALVAIFDRTRHTVWPGPAPTDEQIRAQVVEQGQGEHGIPLRRGGEPDERELSGDGGPGVHV